MSLSPFLGCAACGFLLAACAAKDAETTKPPRDDLQFAHFLLKKVP